VPSDSSTGRPSWIGRESAGSIDWVAHWQRIVRTRRSQIEALATEVSPRRYWDDRAARFARFNEAPDLASDPLLDMLIAELQRGGTLLDVGAGAGRYCVPLARLAGRVTAVEPSQGMRDELKGAAAKAGVANIDFVMTTWEAAPAQLHDVVLASHVLYAIEDIAPFVLKLDRCARRACYIAIRVDQLGTPMTDLWREVRGMEPPPEPAFPDLLNLLFALGIRPNSRLMTLDPLGRFSDLDDAVDFARRQLFLTTDDSERDERIRRFLADTLVPVGSRLTWPQPQQAAIVWWNKRDV
jgi:SAM-dependent methyltransferase